MRIANWLFFCILTLSLAGCSKSASGPAPEVPVQSKSAGALLRCGAHEGEIFNRMRMPSSWDGKRFAILLAGSPGTRFFGDQTAKNTELINRLVERGFKTIEIAYADNTVRCGSGKAFGFYALCCGQGIEASHRHAASLYDYAVKAVGYNPSDRAQTLVGVGFSLGSVQLMAAAYAENRHFDRLALTGLMYGDNERGCLGGQTQKLDGLAWTWFMPLADFITQSTRGCSQKEGAPLEFTKLLNFENLPYAQDGELAIFEGLNRRLGAHDEQANYVASKRLPGATALKFYEGCGHDTWACSKASAASIVSDHLEFLTK